MKRQSERDSSPGSAPGSGPGGRAAKRPRERDRERERESRAGREEGDTGRGGAGGGGNYHKAGLSTKHPGRSRSRSRDRPGGGGEKSNSNSRREDRGDHHHHHHEAASSTRLPSARTSSTQKNKGDNSRPAGLEYKTLVVSNLGTQLTDEAVEDGLFHEFKKFGEVSVSATHTPEGGRLAYVHFRHHEDAKEARHAKGRLVLYDRPLKIEPVYPKRRSCTPPEVNYVPIHTGYQYRQRSLSPGACALREQRTRHANYPIEAVPLTRERERSLDYYGLYDERGRAYSYPVQEDDLMPEDDKRATRNLFIGNLDHNISESDLRRAFEKYGIIEEVVIKRPARGQGGAYGFLKFQNLDMAHRAKVAMSGRVIGRNHVKIGYGKANPTTRLWVGGLGPLTSLAALAREFDRFGSIRTIDYVKGDSFAYIQYESLDAAQAACAQMRGFPLGGPDRRLRVDFAKVEDTRYQQPYPQVPLPVPYELLADGFGRHRSLEREARARDRTPPLPLYHERERSYLDGDWSSPAKNLERRNNADGYSVSIRNRDRWPSERENDRGTVAAKPWEERRKRRSLSNERIRPVLSPYEERARAKPRGSLEPSPDKRSRDARGADGTTDKDQVTAVPPEDRRPPVEDKALSESHDPVQLKKKDNERNHRTSEIEHETKASVEAPKPETKKPANLLEFAQALTLAWNGVLVLKNSCFPTNMFTLEGDAAITHSLLKDSATGARVSQLKIAQRLRLDQPKLDEVTRRIKQGSPDGYVVLLAMQAPQGAEGGDGAVAVEPGLQQRLLRNLVSYLKQKQAAGVIGLPVGGVKDKDNTGMLYAFPPCGFSQQFLQTAMRTLGKVDEEHLIVVIVRDSV
ncbi:putative RNA-binding protein 15B [Carcharodon carcharias]|uniref:putative RNA-binding protein 15B n=1 Tax=Carcharodon carcharias TaxID=13397 RepID=UPI001B7E3BE5|nr:putative RNA-binding protein 15B [Carcharodon carcharias]